jgi:hypothetical protein
MVRSAEVRYIRKAIFLGCCHAELLSAGNVAV